MNNDPNIPNAPINETTNDIPNTEGFRLNGGRLTISEIAKHLGVTPKTIIRWEKAGKIHKPKRDWKGWRFYLQEDLEAIQKYVSSVYVPELPEPQAQSI